jgi:hypothetical protein
VGDLHLASNSVYDPWPPWATEEQRRTAVVAAADEYLPVVRAGLDQG